MAVKKLFYSLLIVFLITSCGRKEKIVPDFSSPEAAFKTSFYAIAHNDEELILETASTEILAKYGHNREEQLEFLKQHLRGKKQDRKSTFEIIRTDYVDENRATVFYKHYVDKKFWAENWSPMVKEEGKWKVALNEKAFT